ncbi:hypothetical protein LXL04_020175 [Taraxacum kok-saghyz]
MKLPVVIDLRIGFQKIMPVKRFSSRSLFRLPSQLQPMHELRQFSYQQALQLHLPCLLAKSHSISSPAMPPETEILSPRLPVPIEDEPDL